MITIKEIDKDIELTEMEIGYYDDIVCALRELMKLPETTNYRVDLMRYETKLKGCQRFLDQLKAVREKL